MHMGLGGKRFVSINVNKPSIYATMSSYFVYMRSIYATMPSYFAYMRSIYAYMSSYFAYMRSFNVHEPSNDVHELQTYTRRPPQ